MHHGYGAFRCRAKTFQILSDSVMKNHRTKKYNYNYKNYERGLHVRISTPETKVSIVDGCADVSSRMNGYDVYSESSRYEFIRFEVWGEME